MALLRRILIPTDFSRNSGAALNYACDLAHDSKATLHLLHVSNGKHHDKQVEHLERIGSMLDARSELSIETVKQVVSGRPDVVIADYVREHHIDLVVMGTHGRTGLAHLAMGSVAENVLRNSPCPVLVLGPQEGENTSINQVTVALAEMVGEGLTAGREEGRGLLLKQLVEKLRMPSTSAILMFDELEDREWIQWKEGTWFVVEGTELVDDFKPYFTELAADTPAIDLVKRAHKLRATDIHIDPTGDDEDVVRLRIDGRLKNYCKTHRNVTNHIVNQLKTYARLDIADPFSPQEGRLQLPSKLSGLDVRLTAVPVPEGQAVAMRLFDPSKVFLPLENLGFSDRSMAAVKSMLQDGEGMILVSGPTGSGKTTTVYSMLQTIGGADQNIVSIEDPVEFVAPFVRQINVDTQHGLTMSEGLRTIMRMDPDVLFIGEIRDPEAAAIGMRAASSGKYVFSTMHTRDIASTISAIRDLGLPDHSVAANLTGIVNQRLVRRLCCECKREVEVDKKQRELFSSAGLTEPAKLFEPVGCANCAGTGYRGRIGAFEVAKIDDTLRDAIIQQRSRQEIQGLLRSKDVVDLQVDALAKAAAGIISYEEAVGIRWIA